MIPCSWEVHPGCASHEKDNAASKKEHKIYVLLEFMRPIKNHAVAKRQAFEAITWLTVPLASVHVGGGDGNLKLKSVAIMPIKLTNRN